MEQHLNKTKNSKNVIIPEDDPLMTLNFLEEIVFDWFRLVKNPQGISISDLPTPRPEGKKGGGHGGDIDILSIGRNQIWVAEVETFGGTIAAQKKIQIIKRKFNEKANFVKKQFGHLSASNKIEFVYVSETIQPALNSLIRKETNATTYCLSEIVEDLMKYFKTRKASSPGPGLTSSVRTIFSLQKISECLEINRLVKYNKKVANQKGVKY